MWVASSVSCISYMDGLIISSRTDHCLAKGLPQPTYELFEWSPPGEGSDSDGTESYWYYAVLTLGSERFQLQYRDLRKLPECDNTEDAKEGLARRVLRYLLGSEDVDPEFALEEERLEITQLNARYEPKTNVEALEGKRRSKAKSLGLLTQKECV